jgi:AbrB family looped-hinge helix DNA binding protein
MKAVSAKLSSRYQMVLPKDARRVLGVDAGDSVLLIIDDDGVRLVPKPVNYASYARGLGKEAWAALGGADAYVAEERASWE